MPMMTQAIPSAPSEKIHTSLDRQNLETLRKRFLQINHDRLARTEQALTHNQRIFLRTLPLLFHCNHPGLPGYVSHSTPCGISNYKPSKDDIAHARSLARSFCLTGGYHGDNIWGIYLMGSVGTLAQTHSSDFDVWLCHRPDISGAGLAELKLKSERIEQWARTLRLDTHIFLMDCEAFRNGQQSSLDAESSGSAQRLLLLDEFYRTALHVAGRLPLWWFCPSWQESEYESLSVELLGKRFIRPDTTLNFGPMNEIPDGEFIGAGIWQLYKAITSPYKSILKLLLMEAYVHDYPAIRPLALDYKQSIYNGELRIDRLDPYIMVYRRIEDYLRAEGDDARLELVRRCLYFKVNKPLSRDHTKSSASWQHELMHQLIEEWGWDENYLKLLDQRPQWKTLQVKRERRQLVSALNRSYEVLGRFAQRSGAARSISSDELHTLGRKLQAAFERRPGKLEWVNPGISKDISESKLWIVQTPAADSDTAVWQLFGTQSGNDSPLRQAGSPVELLLWCHTNGLIEGHANIDTSRAPELSNGQLRQCLSKLQKWLPNPVHSADHEAFTRPSQPTHALLLINVAAEASSSYGTPTFRLSEHSDPFSYGSRGECLIASIDLIVRNSWQEISCHRFTGKRALLQVLAAYAEFCVPGSNQAPPFLDVECLGNQHANRITQRVSRWFQDINTCYYTGIKPPSTRFVFALAGKFCSLQFKGPRLILLEHKHSEQLLHYLGEPQSRYSPIVVDEYTLRKHPLRLIAKRSSSRAVNVFFQQKSEGIEVWIVDEKGSLVRMNLDRAPQMQPLNALHLFLRRVLNRLQRQADVELPAEFGVHTIEFYEMRQDYQGILRLAPRVVRPAPSEHQSAQLDCRVTCNQTGQFEYHFTCEQQVFSWDSLGHDVFYTTADFILRLRKSDQAYPIFITDLHLSACAEQLSSTRQLQLSHYLRFKMDVEQKLSGAVKSLQ